MIFKLPAWMTVIGAFLLGNVVSPFISKYVEKIAERIIDRKSIRIDACAPLKDARILIRKEDGKGEKIIADQKIDHINETSVFVQNTTDKPIKNATLTIYPLSQANTKPEIWYTRMYGSSMKGVSLYKVQKDNAAYQIEIPLLAVDEFISVETKFGQPIAYVIELFSEDVSKKLGFEPGCDEGAYIKSVPPTFFYSYYGTNCEKPANPKDPVKCENEYQTPFEITEEMRGKKISIETKVTY